MKSVFRYLTGLLVAAGTSIFGLLVVFVLIFVPVGWIINLVEVIGFDGKLTETTEGTLMIIGVVLPPLGAVMGWFV